MLTATRRATPITHTFADDGRIPNNPSLPFVLYRGGIDLTGSPDPEKPIEKKPDVKHAQSHERAAKPESAKPAAASRPGASWSRSSHVPAPTTPIPAAS